MSCGSIRPARSRAAPGRRSSETYTVGELPIAGRRRLHARGGRTGQEGRAQHEDPRRPAYVTVRASRAGVTLRARESEWNGVHGAVPAPLHCRCSASPAATLEPGDTVTFTYGDRSQGSKGIQVPTFSNDVWLLPIYVDPRRLGELLRPALADDRDRGQARGRGGAPARSVGRRGAASHSRSRCGARTTR